MTATTTEAAGVGGVETHQTSLWQQSWIMVRRSMIHTKRMPEMLSDVTIQPIMFTVLFAFVFGSAIPTEGVSYREYLLPGILGQTMVFTCFVVAGGLTTDLEKGVIDRFRSLPISRASVLIGRSIASLLHSSIGIVVMCLTGLAIGWRIRTNPVDAVLGFVVLLVFGFAMIWFGILVGCMMQSIEAVNGFMFATMFPITFLSNAFVPTAGMAPWLRAIAEWNPVSSLVQAMRELWGNDLPLRDGAPWSLQHPVLATVIWSILLTAVFAPLAVRGFNKRTVD
ncbi:ABC transporter permease [Tsukamurella tyrosinosolvens]|uniref:ABC transporter permease n=1 Tax=Tsukamurella tyrosinosolvens TaxID=57704 RepID=UPI00248102C4|nr:ABC transporter permease [Tsukamurella tyrosinosolvens]WEL91999.1 ABC transporter permease [Tsukamurella tyrosinosolvens]